MRLIPVLFLSFALALPAATIDGSKIHSTTAGRGSKTVILIHGYTCDETSWSEQVPALAKEYRVVTVDLPGHGHPHRRLRLRACGFAQPDHQRRHHQ